MTRPRWIDSEAAGVWAGIMGAAGAASVTVLLIVAIFDAMVRSLAGCS